MVLGGATYQRADLGHTCVGSLVARNALDASLLDAELARKPLELRVHTIAGSKVALMHGVLIARVDNGVVHAVLPIGAVEVLFLW